MQSWSTYAPLIVKSGAYTCLPTVDAMPLTYQLKQTMSFIATLLARHGTEMPRLMSWDPDESKCKQNLKNRSIYTLFCFRSSKLTLL